MKSIKKENLREAAFKSILNMIMQNKMLPGDKLPSENKLKDELGISRHTVRDALNNLSMLGITEGKQGDGNYVKSVGLGLYMNLLVPYLVFNSKNLITIMQFRQGIETSSARYAALNATPEDISSLEEKFLLRERKAEDYDYYIDADMDFHCAIAKASKNEILIQCMHVIRNYCHESLEHFINQERSNASCNFHKKILEAIKDKDSNSSADFMNDHMKDIIRFFSKNTD